MPTFLLTEQPITSFDDYFATETGALGIKRAQELGPDAIIDRTTRCHRDLIRDDTARREELLALRDRVATLDAALDSTIDRMR